MVDVKYAVVGVAALAAGALSLIIGDFPITYIHYFVAILSAFAILGVVYLMEESGFEILENTIVQMFIFIAIAFLLARVTQSTPALATSFIIGFGIGLIGYSGLSRESGID